MNRNRLVSIITPIVVVLLMIAAFFAGVRLLKNSDAKLDKEREKIEAEYEALHEKNVDEATGKKILTEKFLEKEYHSFYLGHKEGQRVFKIIIVAFSLIVVAICAIYALIQVFSALRRGNSPNILKIILYVAPIPIVLILMVYITRGLTGSMPPKPEDAKITVYPIRIVDKNESVSYDDDGDKHTTYYIYIDYGTKTDKRMVTKSMYDEADKKGIYYLIQAEGGDKVYDVDLYSTERYVWEEDL